MSKQPVQNPHDALFKEMFSKAETARSFFQNYLPDDIRDRPDWSTLLVRAVILAMKMATTPNEPVLETLFDQLNEILIQKDATSMVRTLLRYLCEVDKEADIADYIHRLEKTNKPRLQEEIMTIAEKLEKKGELRGELRGELKGQNDALRASTIEILEIRFHSVSYSIKARIEQMEDADRLRYLNRLAVQVDSIADFEQKMNASA